MNVTGVAPGSVEATTMGGASRLGGPGAEDRMQAAIGSAAQLFGMTSQQLGSAMAGGQSLSDIAASKGVSQTDLLSAIKQGIQQATPQGSTGPSGSLLNRIANRIAAHHPGRGRHHRRAVGPTTDTFANSAGAPPAPVSTVQAGDSRLDALA